MAEIKVKIKMQIPGGGATPAVGATLGQYQVSIMDFCKQFNERTADRKGQTVPIIITVYKNKKFEFVIKTPPTSELIRKKLNIKKGSSRPNVDKVGTLSMNDIEEIAKIKMPDLNAFTIEQAKKVVMGSARSMGVKVSD